LCTQVQNNMEKDCKNAGKIKNNIWNLRIWLHQKFLNITIIQCILRRWKRSMENKIFADAAWMALSAKYNRSIGNSDDETSIPAKATISILFKSWIHIRLLFVEGHSNSRCHQYNSY